MLDKRNRLRLRRKYKRSRQNVEGRAVQADQQLEEHVFRRLSRFNNVRRFVVTWVLLIVMLSGVAVAQTRSLRSFYLDPAPVAGGTYTEGFVGAFTNANPLYATGQVDQTVSTLVFSGLLKLTGKNNLVGDLAKGWEVDRPGTTYTVKLKDNVVWHDGEPLTADDVVFTFEMAGHPDTKSPFFQTWRQVDVRAIDKYTVEFKLKSPLAAFAYSLTTGIIPKHLLADFPPEQLRSASFNTISPVGSGPFKWSTIETLGTGRENIEQHVGLSQNPDFHGGPVKLSQFRIHTYTNQEKLLEAFKKQRISAMVGLDQVPDEVIGQDAMHTYTAPMMAGNYVFFKTDQPPLDDVKVRRALLSAVDTSKLYESLGYPAIMVDEPILKEHLLYNSKFRQRNTNLKAAQKLLTDAGWKLGQDGTRTKKNKPLHIKIFGQSTSDFNKVSQWLQEAWEPLGVQVEVTLQSAEELQSAVNNRVYDVLISGVTIGPDPDVFVFWHSSQASERAANRLNFSHYANDEADLALEAARTRSDPKLRQIKIDPFLEAWQKDVPGFGLYQPRFIYITHGEVYNFEVNRITHLDNRFWNVHEWMIRQGGSIKQTTLEF